jgi:mannan endo-1,4-beta-mannosidase
MKYRLVTIIAFLVSVTAIGVTTHNLTLSTKHPVVHAKLPPKSLSYLGVYEPGAPPGYGSVTAFSRMAGRRPNLVGYYSGWAEPFNTSFADLVHRHGATPYIQIDPSLATVSAIAAGTYDDNYLRPYADSVRDFGHPVVIGFGHEMNATWYSWGYRHIRPPTFVAAWRHIVTLFNNEGAKNVTWLWTVNQDQPGTGPIASWWPGPRFVTWVGIDGYYFKSSDTFDSVFGSTIENVRHITNKPILLSETAISPKATPRFAKIGDLFTGMQKDKTLGLVWFDKDQKNDGYRHQDWRIEGNFPAETAFSSWVGQTLMHH